MQAGHAGMTCRQDMQAGHEGMTCRQDMQAEHVGRTCRQVQGGRNRGTNTKRGVVLRGFKMFLFQENESTTPPLHCYWNLLAGSPRHS
jgi:hypothetical protein